MFFTASVQQKLSVFRSFEDDTAVIPRSSFVNTPTEDVATLLALDCTGCEPRQYRSTQGIGLVWRTVGTFVTRDTASRHRPRNSGWTLLFSLSFAQFGSHISLSISLHLLFSLLPLLSHFRRWREHPHPSAHKAAPDKTPEELNSNALVKK